MLMQLNVEFQNQSESFEPVNQQMALQDDEEEVNELGDYNFHDLMGRSKMSKIPRAGSSNGRQTPILNKQEQQLQQQQQPADTIRTKQSKSKQISSEASILSQDSIFSNKTGSFKQHNNSQIFIPTLIVAKTLEPAVSP
ncbi:MAG: hypothetical protein EZS28_036899 [Streblomastix strix]|uniref:Uncharacterized protein n=1 Tax=Streblomastix strix TaxID=222440 RepID=A0A5J4UBH5_9EUKA|nr:MAG: hypothetical protein EZS28_036899 [Streblomastix strix]